MSPTVVNEIYEVIDNIYFTNTLPVSKNLFLKNYLNNKIKLKNEVLSHPDSIKYQALKELIYQHKNIYLTSISFNQIKSNPYILFQIFLKYGTVISGGGSQVMYNKIFSEKKTAILDPSNGPNTEKFFMYLKRYGDYYSSDNIGFAKPEFYNLKGGFDFYIDSNIKNHPNPMIFYNTWLMIDELLGHLNSDRLFKNVVSEGINNGTKNGVMDVYGPLIKDANHELRVFLFDPLFNFDFFYKLLQCYVHENDNDQKGSQEFTRELLHGMVINKAFRFPPNKHIDESNWGWEIKSPKIFLLMPNLFVIILWHQHGLLPEL